MTNKLIIPTMEVMGNAAWMTGEERYPEVDIMSCYAFLFVNVNPCWRQ